MTSRPTAYDAVVVGAGPNGLVAAITLAAAGRSVHVIEAAPTIGGGCRSAELTLPGYVHDVCAAVHALGAVSPAFTDLPLARLGVEWLVPDVPLAHPLDDGRVAVMHRGLDATADGLGVDAGRWRRLMGPSMRNWDAVLPSLLGPIASVPRHPIALARFGIPALMSASLVQRRFRTAEASALFAGCAAHAFLPLTAPLTASFGMMLSLTAQTGGWPFARGGSQTVVDALAAHLIELGGTIETDRPIGTLAELPPHRAVLFDTNPAQLASIAGDRLPERYRDRLRRFRHGGAAYKVDYALDGPVPWSAEACHRAGTVHVGGTFDEIRAAEADVAAGRMPERPFVLVAQPNVVDSGRSPEGSHTLWAYAHVPNGYTEPATDALEAQIERFAPGFRDRVLARHVTPPMGFERYNANYVGGDIGGGSHGGLQLVFRPTVRLQSYSTPDPALFLCSASAPPGGGVHGMCGRNAAHAALAGVLR